MARSDRSDKMGYEEWEVENVTESEFDHVLVVVAVAGGFQGKEKGSPTSEARRTSSDCVEKVTSWRHSQECPRASS